MPSCLPVDAAGRRRRAGVHNPAENHEMVEPGQPNRCDYCSDEVFGDIGSGDLGAQHPDNRADLESTVGHRPIIL
jgi:hypothetical protein